MKWSQNSGGWSRKWYKNDAAWESDWRRSSLSGGQDDLYSDAYEALTESRWDRAAAASNGDVLLCQHGNRRIVRVTNDLRVTTFVDKFEGKRFNAPNDVVYRTDGTLFFTDPPYGLPLQDADPEKDIPFNGVYKMKDGKVDVIIKDHREFEAAFVEIESHAVPGDIAHLYHVARRAG